MNAPGYWMYETSGVLAPVVKAYLEGLPLDAREVGIMRSYLRQWMENAEWRVERQLIDDIDRIQCREDIHAWLAEAMELGIDPL